MNRLKTIVFAALILFLLSSLTKNLFEYKKNYQFYLGYKQDYEQEKKKNISLKTAQLKSKDPYELEKTIRNQLGLSKPNETIIVVPQPTPTIDQPSPTPAPVYQQWWNTFFGN